MKRVTNTETSAEQFWLNVRIATFCFGLKTLTPAFSGFSEDMGVSEDLTAAGFFVLTTAGLEQVGESEQEWLRTARACVVSECYVGVVLESTLF